MLSTIAIIPARFASVRLPAKPLRLIAGKSLIHRVYDAVQNTGLFDRVIVATDHVDIYQHVHTFHAEVVMTSIEHQSGTDRIAECVDKFKIEKNSVIVNVQGDEPFISYEPLKHLIETFNDTTVECASLMHTIEDSIVIHNPNNVKVVVDNFSNAIYFSRSVIPFNRDNGNDIDMQMYYQHIGVYAYRPELLLKFVRLPMGHLERIEKLEQLRLLENGHKIRMVLTDYTGIGIDTEDDLRVAELKIMETK
jgi:3-deoxy-manno-octulosonate cytidylyltransferase (CMP-KDO synthetase)